MLRSAAVRVSPFFSPPGLLIFVCGFLTFVAYCMMNGQ